MKFIAAVVSGLFICSLAFSAEPIRSAQELKKGFIEDCASRGVQHGDNPDAVYRFCSCTWKVLSQTLSVAEFIQMDSSAAKGDPTTLASWPRIQPRLQSCKDPESSSGTSAQPVPENCKKIVKTHGFLSRAQFQCGFADYSQQMMANARSCTQSMSPAETFELLKVGFNFFDQEEKAKGHDKLCNDILRDFPSYVRK